MDCIELALDNDIWWVPDHAVMKLRVPKNAGNLNSCKPVSFSIRTLLHGVSESVSK